LDPPSLDFVDDFEMQERLAEVVEVDVDDDFG
jgi:hypothetical protein